MNPMCPAVIGRAEGAHVGETAPADAITRLEQRKPASRAGDAARGGDAGGAGADDDDVEVRRGLRGERRMRGRRGGSGEERAAAQCDHGFRKIDFSFSLPEPAHPGKSRALPLRRPIRA